MTVWTITNATVGGLVALSVIVILARWHDRFNDVERIGMGLLGGGCLMTIAPILWTTDTPFEEWSGALFRLGILVFFFGHMMHRRLAK